MSSTTYIPAGPRAMERLGQRFGRWTVEGVLGYRESEPDTLRLLVRCECGKPADVPLHNLTMGRSRGCADCGRKTAHATMSTRRQIYRERVEAEAQTGGRVILGWKKRTPLYACPCCGSPSEAGRCRTKASADRAGIPRKYPKSTTKIGQQFGVSRQRIEKVAKERGWDAMLAYFAARRQPR